MKFAIGTTNKDKISSASKVIMSILQTKKFTIEGLSVDSSVPETPFDLQTKQGATNRAMALQSMLTADYYIGLESGLVERYGEIYEEAWCCIVTHESRVYGYSSGLRVPTLITQRMQVEKLRHFEVMRLLREELGQPNDRDTWGNYSHKMLVRTISFEEALRNALVQLFAPEESLYHL